MSVIDFSTKATIKDSNKPVDSTVKMLESLLERAKKGELRALATAYVTIDKDARGGYAGCCCWSVDDIDVYYVMGHSIGQLHHHYFEEVCRELMDNKPNEQPRDVEHDPSNPNVIPSEKPEGDDGKKS